MYSKEEQLLCQVLGRIPQFQNKTLTLLIAIYCECQIIPKNVVVNTKTSYCLKE